MIIILIKLIKKRRSINFMRIDWFFIWTNLNPLHQRMLCAKFGWNRPSGSGEEDQNVKSLCCLKQQQRQQRQQRQTTNKFWSEKLTWAFGSGELRKPKTPKKQDKLKRYIFKQFTVFLVSPFNTYFTSSTSPQQTQTPYIGNTISKFTDTNLTISYK